jgi:glycosyltransferase involved in cell wall biosynthesis
MLRWIIWRALSDAAAGLALVLGLLVPKRRHELVWGPVPIKNNTYWSEALRRAGWRSTSLVHGYYSRINQREDFNLLFDDLVPQWVRPRAIRNLLGPVCATLYVMRNARVVHIPFSGGPLGQSSFWRLEAYLYRWAGIRVVVIPYGADAYMYSSIFDPSLRHALLTSYPVLARRESGIRRRVVYWSKHGDCVLCGVMIDGLPRWDVPASSFLHIDVDQWIVKEAYSRHDGITGAVRVIHTPNHRGFKGTEFLVHAIEILRSEGLDVELVLVEGVQNDEVRRMMKGADILAEQFIAPCYALSALEGMATGLPVLSNLQQEVYTTIFRRYSFLGECPLVSTTPETLVQNLRVLVTRPELREQLGRAGRAYVEKYHSYEAARYLFESVYRSFDGEAVDLINLFHPLKSQFNARRPLVRHPLVENRFPADLLAPHPAVPDSVASHGQ